MRYHRTEQHKQHQLLTVMASKNFISGHEREKKCTLHISLEYSPHDCPLVSADGYHKDKNGPLDPEQTPLFKLHSYLWAISLGQGSHPQFMTRRIILTLFVLTSLLSQMREYPDQHELHQGLGLPLISCLVPLDKVLDGLFNNICLKVLPSSSCIPE